MGTGVRYGALVGTSTGKPPAGRPRTLVAISRRLGRWSPDSSPGSDDPGSEDPGSDEAGSDEAGVPTEHQQRQVRPEQLDGHVVVYGVNQVGRRTVDELVKLGETVVAVERPDRYSVLAGAVAGEMTISVTSADLRSEDGLRSVGVPTAKALVLCADDDVGNLRVALAARRLSPRLRLVVRMFRLELGERIEGNVPNLLTLSNSRLAAPAFVGAALSDDWRQRVEVRDHELVLDRGRSADGELTLPGDRRLPVSLRPAQRQRAATSRLRTTGGVGRILHDLLLDRRLHAVVAVIAVLVATSTVIFSRFAGLSVFQAFYRAVTEVATTGIDPAVENAPVGVRLWAVLLLFAAAALLAALYALFTDALVSVRLSRALGVVPRRVRGHVVVCGLGAVGLRVAERLLATGVPVAAVELTDDAPLIMSARRQGIAAVIGDARFPTTLREVQCHRARAVVLATRDDLTNLEAGMMVRSEFPGVRVVLRMYDPDLARQARELIPGAEVLSTAGLAAPAFAAAALGPEVVATLEHEKQLYVVVEAGVDADAQADGATVAEVEAGGSIRVLGVDPDGTVQWRPGPETVVLSGDTVIAVAAPRTGLPALLDLVRTGARDPTGGEPTVSAGRDRAPPG